MISDIRKLIFDSPLADTHEHLVEEHDRLNNGALAHRRDIGILFTQYVDACLVVAGMAECDVKKLENANVDPEEKWRLVRPWWEQIKSSGYGMMVRETLKILYDADDVTNENWREINDKIEQLITPGFYNKILKDKCNLHHCQVNALDVPIFRESAMPHFLLQDLCVSQITSDFDPEIVSLLVGREPAGLNDCTAAIDRAFELYGPRAVAIKNQSAYRRKIDYEIHTPEEAQKSFQQCADQNWDDNKSNRKPLEDYLFHYSVKKSIEFSLPYKMHTGVLAGHSTMPLHRVRHNAGDMCELCRMHPDARFVFMHCTWPYQDEAIAVAKQWPNAYIDMCWIWMINPVAGVRFLKEFLTAVPANKVFTFGGDLALVEMVTGHAHMTRMGIAQALEELIDEGWLARKNAPGIAERLLLKNALEFYALDKLMKKPA